MPALATPAQRAAKIKGAVAESRKRFLTYSLEKQQDLVDLYSEAAREIQRQLAFYADVEGSITGQRLTALLRDVNRTIEAMGTIRDGQIDRGIKDSARMGIESYAKPLDLAGYGTGEMRAVFGVVHRDTVEAMYDFIAGDGLQLSDRLWKLNTGAKEKVTEVIERAVIQGDSARETAQNLLRRGQPVSKEVLEKLGVSKSAKIGAVAMEMFTPGGQGNIVHNALRVARTELARANNEGFLRTGKKLSTVTGHRWTLTASHSRRDMCDTLATQDIDGLGPGGYKIDNYPMMAHPEDMCFPVPIFEFELEAAA